MFEHRELPDLYPAEQVLQWLRWLAGQMMERGQTLFLIEGLQPNWLGSGKQINLYRLIVGLSVGLIFGLSVGPNKGLSVGLSAGLIFGLIVGLSDTDIKAHEDLNFSLKNALIGGLLGGLIGGMFFGLTGGLAIGLLTGLITGLYDIKSWQEFKVELTVMLIVMLIFGLIVSLIFGLILGLGDWLNGVLIFGLTIGLIGDMRSAEAKFKKQSNQGIWQSLKNGLIVALGSGIALGPIVSLYAIPLFVLLIGYFFGLNNCIQHLVLRSLLYHQDHIPWNYARFLDYASARLFLRKVGGGYVFVHRMIMEHFASLSDEDIGRIVRGVK